MRSFRPILALMLLATLGADAPTTSPVVDASTPMAMLRSSDALAGAGPQEYLRFYNATTDQQQRIADAESKVDAQFGMLQVMLEKKWGASAATSICHALGNLTAADAQPDGLKIDGDHATVAWKDDFAPMKLIRVDGQWKFDLAVELADSRESVDEFIDGYRKMSQLVADFADEIDNGKIATAAQATDQAKARLAVLWGSTN